MDVRYIGKKPFCIDRLYGSGAMWHGKGDIQPVPDAIAHRMVASAPSMYEEVKPDAPPPYPAAGELASDSPLKEVVELPDGTKKALEKMRRADLFALAKGMGLNVRPNAAVGELLTAIVDVRKAMRAPAERDAQRARILSELTAEEIAERMSQMTEEQLTEVGHRLEGKMQSQQPAYVAPAEPPADGQGPPPAEPPPGNAPPPA